MNPSQTLESVYDANEGYDNGYVNILVSGDPGTGKTVLAETCPTPVLMHQFDPDGEKSIRKDIIKPGKFIIDKRFNKEDPRNPRAWSMWDTEFERLKRSGIFKHIGTYFLDSTTTWTDSYMHKLLVEDPKADINEPPQIQHYLKQTMAIRIALGMITSLPCNVVLTSHLDYKEDQNTKRTIVQLMVTGRELKQKIIIPFSEWYVAQVKPSPTGGDFRLLTRTESLYKARTKIGRDVFDKHEKPDIRYLLKKAGYPYEDKPDLI